MNGSRRFYYGDIQGVSPEDVNLEEVTIKHLRVVEKLFFKGLTVGYAGLSFTRNSEHKSIKAAVSDGDTVGIGVFGNLSTRFIGIDTPEKSFHLLKSRTSQDGSTYTGFISLDNEKWANFLANPFTMNTSSYLEEANDLPPFGLNAGLYEYLKGNLVTESALNHRLHANAATWHLEALITEDQESLLDSNGEKVFKSPDELAFFLAFASQIMDGYGRLLCVLKPDEADPPAAGRSESYNLRMLKDGKAGPYFIWPNIDPWRKQEFILNAVIERGKAHLLTKQGTLKKAREYVQSARAASKGVFGNVIDGQNQSGPLRLMPNEIRYLAARRPPSRYVIDLGENTPWPDTLLHPENYHLIGNLEDRLYIPAEYVPLFVERENWKVQP